MVECRFRTLAYFLSFASLLGQRAGAHSKPKLRLTNTRLLSKKKEEDSGRGKPSWNRVIKAHIQGQGVRAGVSFVLGDVKVIKQGHVSLAINSYVQLE